MKYHDKLRFNSLRKENGILQSSLKILTSDNARKTKELFDLKNLIRMTARVANGESVKGK